MPLDIRSEIEALPPLVFGEDQAPPSLSESSPFQAASRLGKLYFRLSASYEELGKQIAEKDRRLEAAAEREQERERQLRRMAEAAIALMDTLDWLHEKAAPLEPGMAREIDAARRDCLRRLAAAGISEVPARGRFDGSLHLGVGTVPASGEVPRYHIAQVARRGYQMGTVVLRPAEVITAQ